MPKEMLNHIIDIKEQLARVETTVQINNAVFDETRTDVAKLKKEIRHVKGFAAGASFVFAAIWILIKEGIHKLIY